MNKKLIIISGNLSFGESLAFTLKTIFGFEAQVIHQASGTLFSKIKAAGIENSLVIIEDGIPGLNYAALIDDINEYSPAYQILLSGGIDTVLDKHKLRSLGCGEVVSPDIGIKGLINATYSLLLGERPIDFSKTPFERFSQIDREFLSDTFWKSVSYIRKKYNIEQQTNYERRTRRFKKLHLNKEDQFMSFRILANLYNLKEIA